MLNSQKGSNPRGTPILKKQGCFSYILGVENVVLLPPRMFSLKKSMVGAFVVSQKI